MWNGFGASRWKLHTQVYCGDGRLAWDKRVSVITGGLGTGKTTILRAVLSVLEALKAKVVLAAPTGMAAKRLSGATDREAKTLH